MNVASLINEKQLICMLNKLSAKLNRKFSRNHLNSFFLNEHVNHQLHPLSWHHIFRNIQIFKKSMHALRLSTPTSKQMMKARMIKTFNGLRSLNRCLNIRLLNAIKEEKLTDFFIENIYYVLVYILIIKLLSRPIPIVRYFLLKTTPTLIKKHNESPTKNEECWISKLLLILQTHRIYILLKRYSITPKTHWRSII